MIGCRPRPGRETSQGDTHGPTRVRHFRGRPGGARRPRAPARPRRRGPPPLAGPRFRPRAEAGRAAGAGPLRHRPGRGLVHDRGHHPRPRTRAQPRPRPRGLHLGGERAGPRSPGEPADARGRGPCPGPPTLRGRALHPMRLARRPEPARAPGPGPGLGAHPRRRPAPRTAGRLPGPALEPRVRAAAPGPARLRPRPRSPGDPRAAAARPGAARAPLRPSGVPASLPRAQRPARGRARPRPSRRVHGPDDVRLLGRGAHERLGEPVPPSAPSWA